MTFNKSDILIPGNADMTKWSVVACDQYTSEPDYWEKVKNLTADIPSAYSLILPEVYLENDGVDDMIKAVNDNMKNYVRKSIFKEYKQSYIYVERTQRNGMVRKGIIGAVDLEDYDYTKGSDSAIRATEGTVPERIPPRLKVRVDAKLELPHVMLLIDDRKKEIIEGIAIKKDSFEKVYDFDLMMDSGHLCGWLLDADSAAKLEADLKALADIDAFNEKYGVKLNKPLVFAVGDGNHSLATAKEYYKLMKDKYPNDCALARYALVELVNLHDDSLVFEAIHRVIFDIDEADFEAKLSGICVPECTEGSQSFTLVTANGDKKLCFKAPTANLTVGSIQNFIDSYIAEKGGRVDYIHGEDVVRELSGEKGRCGILLDAMDKNDLFKTVILDGALPRKTFSMGEAYDKRFYTEARIINDKI